MNDKDLCAWLRENSSGAYRTSATAADRIEELLTTQKEPVAKLQCSDGLSGVWISVKTRLPEAGEIVLWWNDDHRMIEFGSAGSFNGENVTYWMPLPKPPAR